MRRLSTVVLLLLILAAPSFGRARLQGYVEQGNTTLTITGGIGSISQDVQGSYPGATVTVYVTGTLTLADLYSDNAGTIKANPFTSSADGSWFLYADNGRYDVRFSGGGITTPFTLPDFQLYDVQDTTCVDVKDSPYSAAGDGVADDTTAIQDAIDAAELGNRCVHIPKGTYKLTDALTVDFSNFALYGDGIGISVLNQSDSTKSVLKIGSIGVALSGYTVDGITFQNAGGTFNETYREDRSGIAVIGESGDACPARTSNILISNNEFINAGNNGVLLQCTDNTKVVGNKFSNSNNGLSQISIHSGNNFIATDNLHYASADEANAYYILHLHDLPCINGTISNNIIYGTFKFEMIAIYGSYMTVEGNTMVNTRASVPVGALAGVRIQQPAGGDTACQTHHITVSTNSISVQPTVYANGIHVKDAGSTGNYGVEYVTIIGNVMENTGIVINDYSRDIVISGNVIDGVPGTTLDGISLQGTSTVRLIITGNIIQGADRHGIFVNGPDEVTAIGNSIRNSTEVGLYLAAVAKGTVTNNVAFSNKYGIVSLGSTDLLYSNNRAYSNTTTDEDIPTTDILPFGDVYYANTKGPHFFTNAGLDSLGSFFRDASDDIIIRNAEVGGDIHFRAGGDVPILYLISASHNLELPPVDLGDGHEGPVMVIYNNTNALNPGAGSVGLFDKGGTLYYVWIDDTGQPRIHNAPPTTANDLAGQQILTPSTSPYSWDTTYTNTYGVRVRTNGGVSSSPVLTMNSSDVLLLRNQDGTDLHLRTGGDVTILEVKQDHDIEMPDSDLGNGNAGPSAIVGYNNNAANTGAGSLVLTDRNGIKYYLWVDVTGDLRINTVAPTTANDLAGTIVGTQN